MSAGAGKASADGVAADKPGAAFIWCPFGDSESARHVASVLVEERLVACANILPGMTSVFRWEGRVTSADEIGVLFKTRADRIDQAVERLAGLHPYDTPAIAGWRAETAPEAVLEWLSAELN